MIFGSGTLSGNFTFTSDASNKFQVKKLTADITANNSDITDLKFTNLKVGSLYRITYNTLSVASSGNVTLDVVNNSVTILRIVNANTSTTYWTRVLIFQATAADLIFTFTESATATLLGNDDTLETFAVLEELNNTMAA